MNGDSGKMWMYVEGSKRQFPGFEQAGIPVLRDWSNVMPNDCVMLADSPTPTVDRISKKFQGSKFGASPWLLNDRAAEVSNLTTAEVERRLRREGVPARVGAVELSGSATPITVAVWGLDAVEVRRVKSGGGQIFSGVKSIGGIAADRTIYSADQAIWKPAATLSVRALYVLGLDFGQVDVLLNDKGKLTVTGISPIMKIAGQEGKRKLADSISSFAADWSRESANGVEAALGADPEFVLLSPEGRIVPASRYFSPEGDAGCDSIRIRGEKRWPLVELRPRPSFEPAQVTADVRRLLRVAAKRTVGAKLSWRAGALPVPGLPLGGHVHLSGAALTGERLRALDSAVGLPLRLLEPPMAAMRRPRYGSLGDVRRQPHGGFEYRTPPSWLVSPRLALGALALAKVAAEHSRELSSHRPLDDDRNRDAFYIGDRTLLLSAADTIYEAIKQTRGYINYREPIDFLFESISKGQSWDESADIRLKWRIPIP
ncbi:putative amidoligase domain-containing protein [Cohnella silvisoli]|uniref:PhiEco32-like amidoligase-type 2 protein n=1 Tax=Cohnella silvisoli TaxID=2873699 RepID=A0ABV1KNT8_9BACL|nr:hypothetical protein [Cohnella silvisoli]MCD9021024.1 hypothetical protein [Cohnella silvisoli]